MASEETSSSKERRSRKDRPKSSRKSSRSRSGPLVRRLKQELQDIQEEEHENISVSALEDDIREWHCLVNGPPDTPYEDGIWKLKIIIGQNWPHHAPRVQLATKIMHVNVQKRVCLSVLDHWDSTYHLVQIPLGFYGLLQEPDFSDPLNTELCDLHKKNEQAYLDLVRNYTNAYAKKSSGNSDNNDTNNSDNVNSNVNNPSNQNDPSESKNADENINETGNTTNNENENENANENENEHKSELGDASNLISASSMSSAMSSASTFKTVCIFIVFGYFLSFCILYLVLFIMFVVVVFNNYIFLIHLYYCNV